MTQVPLSPSLGVQGESRGHRAIASAAHSRPTQKCTPALSPGETILTMPMQWASRGPLCTPSWVEQRPASLNQTQDPAEALFFDPSIGRPALSHLKTIP